jgi:hypothetical protein
MESEQRKIYYDALSNTLRVMFFLMLVGAHSHPKNYGSTRDSAKDR